MYHWRLQKLHRNKDMLERRTDVLKAMESIKQKNYDKALPRWMASESRFLTDFEFYLEMLEGRV